MPHKKVRCSSCGELFLLDIRNVIDKPGTYAVSCPNGHKLKIKIGTDEKDNATDQDDAKSNGHEGLPIATIDSEIVRIPKEETELSFRPQFYPGSTSVVINRRKHMSGNLEKLRDIPEADVMAIMGYRAPGADYSSTHPPLKEMGEPDHPAKQIVAPAASAAAGNRVRHPKWTDDSMYFAPSTPYWRSYWGAINCKGCDPGTLSGRQIIEAREKDIEAYTKAQYDSELTDIALCSMRGCTVHSHSLRLEENGMQFDMLARNEMGADGNLYAVKDQVGIPLDKKIDLGKPMTEAEAKKRTTIVRVDNTILDRNVEKARDSFALRRNFYKNHE